MNKSVPVEKNIFFDTNRLKYLGKNVIIGKTVRIRQPEKVSIGDNTIIDDFTYISCAMEIGKNCHIASNVSISGGTGKLVIGNYSTISSGCSVHCASSDYRSCSLDLPSVPTHQQFGGIVGDFLAILRFGRGRGCEPGDGKRGNADGGDEIAVHRIRVRLQLERVRRACARSAVCSPI